MTGRAVVLKKAAGLDSGGAVWSYWPLFMALPAVAIAHAIGVVVRQPERVPRVFQVGAYPLGGRYLLFRRVGFLSAFVLTGVLLMLFLFTPVHLSPFIYYQF